jgi:alkylresorcinol/alkylpyrone synthase
LGKITSIATAVPQYTTTLEDMYQFLNSWFGTDALESRKLKFLMNATGITKRYLSIPYLATTQEKFYPSPAEANEYFPSIEERMERYRQPALSLSMQAIKDCLADKIAATEITHLITVSCTGLSAPGLDLEIISNLGLSNTIERTSINFMGCFAAVHGLKIANALVAQNPNAKVVIVCTEICSLHFQKEATVDNITASMLFGDGSAAALIEADTVANKGIILDSFYSEILPKGKNDMSWNVTSTGFLMTLSSYVSDLIEADFGLLTHNALQKAGLNKADITNWCIHPGGKRILQAIEKSIGLTREDLSESYSILNDFGNMSSPTVLFVLKEQLHKIQQKETESATIFAAAFGPGLTAETFTAHYG